MTEQGWKLVDNPAWAGKRPEAPLERSDCHDNSHFLTVQCQCGDYLHMHETQLAAVPAGTGMVSRCTGCHRPLIFKPGFFAGAFAEMRRGGWIA
jgi:hypothetical protein